MTKFYYQGHGSYRFTLNDGRVIYVDPFAGDGYNLEADFILVTHGHSDHNKINLITQKPDCVVITYKEALQKNRHNIFVYDDVRIESVEARNVMHSPKSCVGYILTIDGIKIYCSGDTSKTKQMDEFAKRHLDYAILCTDGIFNMGLKESAECAEIIKAKHNIPVHIKPGSLFSKKRAEKWKAPNKLIVLPGTEITL
jgi:L-ascorbate metabolism protein UlaG (beta-lactamase superfamily)